MSESQSKKKVLFVSHSGLAYGAERSLLALVTDLAKNSNVTPEVLLPCKGFLSEKLENEGIAVTVFPYYFWITSLKLYPFNLLGFLLNYILVIFCIRKLKKRHFDVVYTNSLATNFGALIAKKLNKKHIWHIREFVQEDLNRFFIPSDAYVKKFVENTTSHIIYNSQVVTDKFTKIFSNTKSTVIYNGFEFSTEQTIENRHQQLVVEQQPINLIIVGTIRHEKGQHDAINCLIELRKRKVDVVLKIIGKGNAQYVSQLQSICKAAGVSQYVDFVGLVDKPLDHFRTAAVSLAASANEAFGRIVVESCSVGCPVVAADSGGLREILVHNKTGLFYKKHDINDMANQVQKLLTEQNTYNAISREAMIDVSSRFSLEKYRQDVDLVIGSVLNDNSYN
jgi:glycosyltransferase involved in cell wall biosynthesis